MKIVLHNTWFTCNINGVDYEAMYVDRGWGYSTLMIRYTETYKRRKWILFGEIIERKRNVYITADSREDMKLPDVITRKESYSAERARRDVESVMARHHHNLKQMGVITTKV